MRAQDGAEDFNFLYEEDEEPERQEDNTPRRLIPLIDKGQKCTKSHFMQLLDVDCKVISGLLCPKQEKL